MLLSRNWWVFLLRGILALIFGIVAIVYPASAFVTLVLIFGAFALVEGIFTLIAVFTSNVRSENWWWLVVNGVLGIAVGLLTVLQPVSMANAWIMIIGVWALVTGIFQVISAFRLRKVIVGEIWLILSGLLSVVFGILVLLDPFAGAVAVGVIIGIYALMYGITLIGLSLNLRKFNKAAVAE